MPSVKSKNALITGVEYCAAAMTTADDDDWAYVKECAFLSCQLAGLLKTRYCCLLSVRSWCNTAHGNYHLSDCPDGIVYNCFTELFTALHCCKISNKRIIVRVVLVTK